MVKRGRSTGKPTAEESARIVACKEGECVACLIWMESGQAPVGFIPARGCDYHHLKSGNIRRGHAFGVGLCGWHHRMLVDYGMTHAEMRAEFGPSLMDGSRTFAQVYGGDAALLERQALLLGEGHASA